MQRISLALVWVSAAVVSAAFFLPWAMIDVREPSMVKQLRESSPARDTLSGLTKDLHRITVKIRRGAQTITGDLPTLSDIPKQVSGVQIPQMANQEKAKVVVALLEIFTKQRQDIGLKSYAVYLVPGLALLCALLLTCLRKSLVVALGITLLCAAVAAVGFWKLLTTNTQTLFVAITIGQGLWLSLWGYVGLAVAALMGTLAKPRAG